MRETVKIYKNPNCKIVENKEYFIGKWRGMLERDSVLVRYKARQFIATITEAQRVKEFDVDLYFAITEKITVWDERRLIVSLLDGTEIECGME